MPVTRSPHPGCTRKNTRMTSKLLDDCGHHKLNLRILLPQVSLLKCVCAYQYVLGETSWMWHPSQDSSDHLFCSRRSLFNFPFWGYIFNPPWWKEHSWGRNFCKVPCCQSVRCIMKEALLPKPPPPSGRKRTYHLAASKDWTNNQQPRKQKTTKTKGRQFQQVSTFNKKQTK